MTAMSDFLEDIVLDMVLNSVAYAEPATVYVALFTVAPSDSGGGTEVLTAGTAYAREPVTAGFSTDDLDTRFSNDAAIEYTTATASWGTVVAMGIFDASTGGNLLFHGSLTSNRLVDNGDTFSFAIDALGVTLS